MYSGSSEGNLENNSSGGGHLIEELFALFKVVHAPDGVLVHRVENLILTRFDELAPEGFDFWVCYKS